MRSDSGDSVPQNRAIIALSYTVFRHYFSAANSPLNNDAPVVTTECVAQIAAKSNMFTKTGFSADLIFISNKKLKPTLTHFQSVTPTAVARVNTAKQLKEFTDRAFEVNPLNQMSTCNGRFRLHEVILSVVVVSVFG